MSQDDILKVLDDNWKSSQDICNILKIRRSSVSKNLKSMYKYRDVYGLDFIFGKRKQYKVRKR